MGFVWKKLPIELRIMIIELMCMETKRKFLKCSRSCIEEVSKAKSPTDEIKIFWGSCIEILTIFKYMVVFQKRTISEVKPGLIKVVTSFPHTDCELVEFEIGTLEDVAVKYIQSTLNIYNTTIRRIFIDQNQDELFPVRKPRMEAFNDAFCQTSIGFNPYLKYDFRIMRNIDRFTTIMKQIDFRSFKNLYSFVYKCETTGNFDFFENKSLEFEQVREMKGTVKIPKTPFTAEMIMEMKANNIEVNLMNVTNKGVNQILRGWLKRTSNQNLRDLTLKPDSNGKRLDRRCFFGLPFVIMEKRPDAESYFHDMFAYAEDDVYTYSGGCDSTEISLTREKITNNAEPL
ncbi:unnamed protein product [Caenorhabditis angaria]|uniref:F-box domain-containing protein n=1 Tax=Caenorhabditis angaria TaxID=860376 RepID=A0A9P1J4W1_9PELO|nr:unnamed protein product [Caenorhabditis angaria]